MALFYLNTNITPAVFYTDEGSLTNLLAFIGTSDWVSIPYLLGRDQSNKIAYLRNGRSSSDVNHCIKDYHPVNVTESLLRQSKVMVHDFELKTQRGDVVASTDKSDIIVRFKTKERAVDLLEAFNVPLRMCPAMLTHPGTLYHAVKRTGSFEEYGWFKNISDWLNLMKYEKPIRRLGAIPSQN
jgi:hypothetical protein